MKYTLRKYHDSDKMFVYDVKKEVYKAYVEKYWGAWNEADQLKRFGEFILDSKDDIKIILIEEKRIGFVQSKKLDDENFEIENICITKEYQNNGIGSSILRNLIDEHKSQDIFLQYFKDNKVGNLYRRLGFEFLEELPFHIKMIRKADK